MPRIRFVVIGHSTGLESIRSRPRTTTSWVRGGWQKPLVAPDRPSYPRQLPRPHRRESGVGLDRGGLWHKVIAGCTTGSLVLLVAACSASVATTRKPATTTTVRSNRATATLPPTATTTGPQTFEPAAA